MTSLPLNMSADAARALHDVLQATRLETIDTSDLHMAGHDPIVPSRFKLGAAVAGALGAQALGIAEIWQQRGGRRQRIDINLAQAAYPGLCTFLHIRQNGHPLPFTRWDGQGPNFFPTRDGRRFYLLYTANYVQHCLRLHAFLGCSTHHEAVARAIAGWDSAELEEALAANKLIGVIARSREDWLAHPQGQWLARQGPVTVERCGDAGPRPFGPGTRPLAGIRVLDMAHVLAGPSTARLLAEQGADVLHVSSTLQPDGPLIDIDTGFGKRSAYINLNHTEDRERLRTLIRQTDVFLQSWRPGALARHGFSAEEIRALCPDIIQASVSCYGDGGPWATRAGYEPLGQAVSGLSIAEGSADAPKLVSTFTLNDYLTAYLTASGIVGALIQRARDGGSYHVHASLTRSSMWVQELDPLPPAYWPDGPQGVSRLPDPDPHHFQETASAHGILRHPSPITRYAETQAYWDRPPPPVGADRPVWN